MNVVALIVTRNRRGDLIEALRTLGAQTHAVHAAVIVDASPAAARAATRAELDAEVLGFPVRYVESDRAGMTVQRNIALAHLPEETGVALWLDDDVLLEPTYVAELVNVFAGDTERRVGAVAGVFQPIDRSRQPWWYRALQRLFLLTGREGSVLPSGINVVVERPTRALVDAEWLFGCAAYRVEAMAGLRFDEDLGRYALLEDVDYSYRVGRRWRLVVNTGARLYHKRSPTDRVSVRELERLHVRNRLRFLQRNRWSALSALAFVWSTLGVLVLHLGGLVLTRSAESRDRVLGTLDGIGACLRGEHRAPVRSEEGAP